jgi:rhomboid protease GluP
MTSLLLVAILGTSGWAFFDRDMTRLLWKDSTAIRSGEYWRLFSVALVHANGLHLLVNSGALKVSGRLVESFMGPLGFLLVFMVGTGGGTVASVVHSDVKSVGASGGIMALSGALLSFAVRYWGLLPTRVRWHIFWAELLGVAGTFAVGMVLPRVDNAAHLGGFLAGLMLGAIVGPRKSVFELLSARQRQARASLAERRDVQGAVRRSTDTEVAS